MNQSAIYPAHQFPVTTYEEAVSFLMDRLPMFSAVGASAIKPGLQNILALSEALGNPHLKVKTVHIAGTNGKGSTSHMIAAALQKAGYKTGLYTSPHLVDIRERVRINGQPMSKEALVNFVNKTAQLMIAVEPSYFELTVAMAFDTFVAEEVDIAVIETGLGGRLDSTNIIIPEVSVITNISYDHVHILGNTLPEIAKEKAGIIKTRVPVVIGETHPETEQLFFKEALLKEAPVYFADTLWELVKTTEDNEGRTFKAVNKARQKIYQLATDLTGDYQLHNIKTTLTACEILNQLGWNLPVESVVKSLADVKKTTGLRGRWELARQAPDIFLDVAHNPSGLQLALSSLKAIGKKQHILIGFVKDKDVAGAIALLPKDAIYYFTQAHVPRALEVEKLYETATAQGLQGQAFATVAEATDALLKHMDAADVALITGSFFVVGEAIAFLDEVAAVPH